MQFPAQPLPPDIVSEGSRDTQGEGAKMTGGVVWRRGGDVEQFSWRHRDDIYHVWHEPKDWHNGPWHAARQRAYAPMQFISIGKGYPARKQAMRACVEFAGFRPGTPVVVHDSPKGGI